MISCSPATAPHSPNTVVDAAARLLAGGVDDHLARAFPDLEPTDEQLLRSAWFNVHQLRIVATLPVAPADLEDVLRQIMLTARVLGSAPAGAVGAAATLVELVQVSDERALAATLVAARGQFSDGELLVAAAALTAAFSTFIADWIGLDPVVVHHELQAGMVDAERRPRGRRRRSPNCLRQIV